MGSTSNLYTYEILDHCRRSMFELGEDIINRTT